jgi:hypothetical protein
VNPRRVSLMAIGCNSASLLPRIKLSPPSHKQLDTKHFGFLPNWSADLVSRNPTVG